MLGYTVVKPLQIIFKGGPSTVIQGQYRPSWRAPISKFAKLTGYSGFGGFDVIETGTEIPNIIEANMRLTHTVPSSHKLGADLLALFLKAVKGEIPSKAEVVHNDQQQAFAMYPEELMRDTNSTILDELPFDGPWSDPEVVKHMTAYIRDDVRYPSFDLESRYNQKQRK